MVQNRDLGFQMLKENAKEQGGKDDNESDKKPRQKTGKSSFEDVQNYRKRIRNELRRI
jgi:hypothetical protein